MEKKAESAKETIFAEMQQRYSLTEREFRDAFRDIAHKEEIEQRIMEIIREKGKKAFKDIKDDMERIRRIAIIEDMDEKDIKKIAVYIKEAQAFVEEKMAEEGKKQIHHAGKMSEETIKMLLFVKEQGGRVSWKEFREYGKETIGLDTDTLNKRRWSLFQRGYIKREGNDLIITKSGLARLREEGY